MRKDWWVPLIGILFFVVTLIAFAIGGEPPGADEGGAKVLDHYKDEKDSIMLGAALATLAGTLFVFFAAYLRKELRAAEGEGGMLSALILIGAAIFATGVAIDSTISFALAEEADKLTDESAQALQALWDNDFMPLAMGITIFLFATGLTVVLYGGLPKWLGWVAILLAVVGITPIGFAAFIGGAIWILIVSVLLTMRNRKAPGAAVPPGMPPQIPQ